LSSFPQPTSVNDAIKATAAILLMLRKRLS
jgi:hypothetical protein